MPITCYVDNKSLIGVIHSTKTVTGARLKIDICIGCEMIAMKKVISVEWCKSELQLADCLTKGTANSIKFLNILKGNLAYILE